MDCHKCKHRAQIPGDAHVQCYHPVLKDDTEKIRAWRLIRSGVNALKIGDLEIIVNPVGVTKGWCNWPLNFDPVWIVDCTGHEEE